MQIIITKQLNKSPGNTLRPGPVSVDFAKGTGVQRKCFVGRFWLGFFFFFPLLVDNT